MPNEVFDIRLFNKGIASNFDVTDIPPEAAQWSENVDSQAEGGVLRGVKEELDITPTPSFVITNGAILDKTIGTTLKKVLVYTDGATIKGNDGILNNTANTLTTQSLTTSNASSFTPQNDICYIGTGNNTPVWAGYYKSGLQFNGGISFNNLGVNDLSLDISDAVVSATTTFKIKILRKGLYTLTNAIYNSQLYSTVLPIVGETVFLNIEFIGTYPPDPYGQPGFPGGAWATNGVATVTGVNTDEGWFVTDLPTPYDGENGQTWQFTVGTYYYKHPDTLTIVDMYAFTTDTTVPTYTLASRKYLIAKEYITLSNDVKVSFAASTGHTQDALWTIIVNPVFTAFKIDPDISILKPAFENIVTFFSLGGFVSGGTFTIAKSLVYGVSFIYDFISEGPIFTHTSYVFTPTLNSSRHDVAVRVFPSLLDSRVTGINIYLGQTTAGQFFPDGYFRLLKSFNIAPNEVFTTYDGGTQKFNLMNSNQISASYEASSGISQDTDSFEMKYSYAVKSNNSLFVAKCFHIKLPNAERMLFKSKPYQLHKFDWVNEYLTLDFVPVAMSSFQGKIFVFGTYKMARINPEQFYIEEQIEGIGCLNNKMVTTTDAGMFWGDANYAYMWDGQKINKLSIIISEKTSITDTINYSWKNFIASDSICVASSKNRTILFIHKDNKQAFVWDIEFGRWDFITIANQSSLASINGALSIPDGSVLVSSTVNASAGGAGWGSGGGQP